MTVSLGLLLLRVVAGLLLTGHGAQKLLGWFGGPGIAGTTGWLQSQGFKPAWFWAWLGALSEFAGGILLVLGFLTPLASIAIFAAMLMAVIKFHWSKGIWSSKGGYEYPLVLLFIALMLALVGPGSYSIDALIGFVLPLPLFLLGLLLATAVVVTGFLTSRQNTVKQEAVA